jgi:hypothetical protein
MAGRLALAVLAVALLATVDVRAEEPRAALLVTAGEGIGTASRDVVLSTIDDVLLERGYDLVPVEELDAAVASACANPACATTGEPAFLLSSLGIPLLVVLRLEEEGDEIRIDISIHDAQGHVQKASNVASMSAVLAKSVKLLLDILPEPGSLPEPEPDAVVEEEEEPAAPDTAVSSAIHEHHHTSPCSGQSCSGHGRCVQVQGRAACACDEGYAPDTVTGLSCLPAGEEPSPEVDQSGKYLGRARRLAIAGFVMDSLGIATLTAGWVFTGVVCGDPFCTMFGFVQGSVLMHGIAAPLRLHALAIANRYSGRKPVDGYAVAGWVAYGLTLASISMMPFSPFFESEEFFIAIPIVYTAVQLVSAVISGIVGGRALALARDVLEDPDRLSIVPYVAPAPGGASFGLAGSF